MSSAVGAVRRLEITFRSGDASCAARLHMPEGPDPVAGVVLGHGLGATREMRLDAYAQRFAEHGIAALAFTYRHFGDSGGTPRQLLSIAHQLEDWEQALAYLQAREDIDANRTAVWGSSFGGGHAITIAARHPELAAAVAQCPFTDGLASARAVAPKSLLKAIRPLVGDLVSKAAGRAPVTVPVVGRPGTAALMTAPDAAEGYAALIPPGLAFRNEVAARIIPALTLHRPGRAAKHVRVPILFCVSDADSVAPADATLRYAAQAPRATVRRYAAGHFAFYLGDAFERIVADQLDFLSEHLLDAQGSTT